MVTNISVLFSVLGALFLSYQYRTTTISIDRFVVMCEENRDKLMSSSSDVTSRFWLFKVELLCLIGMCCGFVVAMAQIQAALVVENKTSMLNQIVYLVILVNIVMLALLLRRCWRLEHDRKELLKQ